MTRSIDDSGNPEPATAPPTDEELEAIEPLAVKNPVEWYEARIKKTRNKIESEKSRRKVSREDPAVAYDKYITAKSAYTKKMKDINARDEQIATLKDDIKKRQKRWQQFRKHLSKSTNLKFDEMLRLNKYSGSLKFQHDDETLDLAVSKSSQGETKDVKALRCALFSFGVSSELFERYPLSHQSGRSFLVLIILFQWGGALVYNHGVFLDAEVRKLTIQSLIHTAKQMKHRQFIFITPQDLSSVSNSSLPPFLSLPSLTLS